MAEVTTDEEQKRGAAAAVQPSQGAGVALADEGTDELPALAAIAVGIALLVLAFIWPTMIADDDEDHSDSAAVAVEETAEEDDGEEAGGEELALPDIPAIQALMDGTVDGDVLVAGDGRTVFLTGVVPDEAARDELIALAQVQENVDEVDASGLTIAVPEVEEEPEPELAASVVDASVSQVAITLEGTVPDEATREAMVSRAISVYSEAQVEDRLVVDPNVELPVQVRVTGSLTDPVLYGQVSSAFDGLDGVEVDLAGFELAESTDLEAALNGLEPIQFASGSSTVLAESVPVIDEAAALLVANPDVQLEIGGHTDSIGAADGNQALSEARAQAVLTALRDRDVTNELQATGFGERRLKVPNDEGDPEAQQENRRIEFRIIG